MLVNSINTKMTYQFIITTHSPFMLSDVPKEFVTCIDVVKLKEDDKDKPRKRIISRPKKSFASNFYDIIDDSFFLKNSMGDFAKSKVNDIINSINDLGNVTNSLETFKFKKYSNEIKNIKINIGLIDDEFLRSFLNKKLEDKIASFDKKSNLELKRLKLEEEMAKIKKELAEMNEKSGEDHD